MEEDYGNHRRHFGKDAHDPRHDRRDRESGNTRGAVHRQRADEEYLWDELAAAAWIDPSIITKEESLYMDIDISHTAGYGKTLVWVPGNQPGLGERLVHVQTELNIEKSTDGDRSAFPPSQ